jgi:hypothetical protein
MKWERNEAFLFGSEAGGRIEEVDRFDRGRIFANTSKLPWILENIFLTTRIFANILNFTRILEFPFIFLLTVKCRPIPH